MHLVEPITPLVSTNPLPLAVTKRVSSTWCRYGMAALDYRAGRRFGCRGVNRLNVLAGELVQQPECSPQAPYLPKPVDALS